MWKPDLYAVPHLLQPKDVRDSKQSNDLFQEFAGKSFQLVSVRSRHRSRRATVGGRALKAEKRAVRDWAKVSTDHDHTTRGRKN